jgi:single-stranded-DNA-specific exonuclease
MRWNFKPLPDYQRIEQLSCAINVNPYLSAVLLQRGVDSAEAAKNFFRPSLEALHDPFLMQDMDRAVERLHRAIEQREKILIYGDYDVDGTTAASMAYLYLSEFHPHCEIYIPDRHREGYGISEAGIQYADENGFSLIIALDCGIKASDKVAKANLRGIDFIICDHHLPDNNIPHAVAVLDPKRPDCNYPYKELSGCGLGFKLLQAYARRYRNEEEVFRYLDLVAVSTASDIVPITGENRILAYHGIRKLNQDPLPGLSALMEISGVQGKADVRSIVFALGPRINAAGRVAHASAAIDLLTARTLEEAREKVFPLNDNNAERRNYDMSITEEARAMIEQDEKLRQALSTVLFKPTWHKGVVGIVAARCIEHYYRPTIILTESDGKITGSARSIRGFDIYEALVQCSDLLEKFGGHRYAAGLTLLPENLEAFIQRFEEVVARSTTPDMFIPVLDIDVPLPLEVISPAFVNVLNQMAPFGPENQQPVFVARKVQVAHSLTLYRDKHLRLGVRQQNSDRIMQAVAFNQGGHYNRLAQGDTFSMAFTVEENNYNGNSTVQVRIKDIKFE